MKKNSVLLAIFAVAVVFTSCGKSYTAKDVTLKNVSDSVNYAMGVYYGNSMKNEFVGDSTGEKQQKFFEAVEKGYNSDIASLSSEEMQAYFQGLDLGTNIKNQPFFGDSAIKVLPKVAQEAITNTMLGKKLKISTDESKEVTDRLFAKFRNDSLPAVKPTKDELDSLNYAIGVSSATQIKEYYLANDSSLKKAKAYIKGLDKGLDSKEQDQLTQQGEGLGVNLKQASKGAGLLNDSSVLADKDLFIQGMVNAIAGKDVIFATTDPGQYLQETQEKQMAVKLEKQYGANKVAGEAFLAENAKKEGVVTTESGLQYKVVKQGSGAVPTESDRVKVHYHGTLIDGTVFDSSIDKGEPIVFGVTGVIAGWTEALKLMPVGSKWTLYVPQNLAYGARDTGVIKPFSTLVFEVELISIEK